MSNWDKYFWEDAPNVMKNKLGIKNSNELRKIEYDISQFNQDLIFSRNINLLTADVGESLKNIHKFLLGEIYEWAGTFRDVNMSKNGHSFFYYERFEMAGSSLNESVEKFRKIENTIDNQLLQLATIHNDINEAHFFREGNGRTQRTYIQNLAKEKGILLDIERNPDQYMSAAISDDREVMKVFLANNCKNYHELKRLPFYCIFDIMNIQ